MFLVELLAHWLLWLSDRIFVFLACVLAVIFVWVGPSLYPLKINNTLATLLEVDTPQEKTDLEIKKVFGDLDEIIILAYHDDELFTEKNLQAIIGTTDRIERIKGIRNCFSLSSTPYFKNVMENGELALHTDPLLTVIPTGTAELVALKRDAVNNFLFINNILSPDGNTAAFNIILQPDLEPFAKERIVREVRKIFQEVQHGLHGRFYFTGMHVFMETTGMAMQTDVEIFSMMSLMMLFVALLFLFRSIVFAMVGLGAAIISNGLLFLTLYAMGRTLSISTTPVPAITMGLALAYSLHVLVAKHEGKLDDHEEAHEIFVGSIFSALTSVIGFATLYLNPIPTLQDFGIYAALGTFYAWLTALFFAYPVLKRVYHRPHPRFSRRFQFLLKFATTKYRKTILAVAALFLMGGFLIFRMEVQTDYYRYYLNSSPMTESVDFVNRTIGGQYPIVIELDTEDADGIRNKNILHWLETFKKRFEKNEGVDKIITYLDLLNEGCRAFNDTMPSDWYSERDKTSQISMIVHDANPDLNGYYINDRGDKTLIFVRTSHINSASYLRILSTISAFLDKERPSGTKYKIGGTYVRCVSSANNMAVSQFQGTFWEIIVLFTVAYFIIHSFRLTLIAFIANLLPICGVYGLLSILGETLNMGTTTIAAISLGIGVDDTIHFVVRYITAFQKCHNAVKSTRTVIQSTGMSMFLAASMIALSFLSLGFSNIRPIYQLGVFTVVTMALCFVSNMLLVPVLITMGHRSSKPDSDKTGSATI
ncbi:MAG: MMPL family transporter [Candidatus Riflebacteria bacterium]|nr:MMPL family transporter [Candidatus Riflebacteria bacterium]